MITKLKSPIIHRRRHIHDVLVLYIQVFGIIFTSAASANLLSRNSNITASRKEKSSISSSVFLSLFSCCPFHQEIALSLNTINVSLSPPIILFSHLSNLFPFLSLKPEESRAEGAGFIIFVPNFQHVREVKSLIIYKYNLYYS